MRTERWLVLVIAVLLGVLTGCSQASSGPARPKPSAKAGISADVMPPGRTSTSPLPSTSPSPSPSVQPTRRAEAPSRFSVRIPSLGLGSLRVIAYRGTADDLAGTRIQDRGDAASPRGPKGGASPGEIGNLIITGHRTSHGAPFARLPSMRDGDHILVTSAGRVYDYVVTDTMKISFRSTRDVARQSAPVPGRLGATPTRAMITLSTCATPEDRADGNFWSDSLGNPEHRINKVGVLVDVREMN